MKIERGDYCVAQVEKHKLLVKIKETGTKQLVGVLANQTMATAATEVHLPLKPDEIIANLGDNPFLGRVYGIKTPPWLSYKDVEPWGRVHFFRDMPKKERKALINTLKDVGKEVVDLGLGSSLPIEIHVRPREGAVAGMFTTGRGADNTDLITYHPREFGGDLDMPYVIWHEDGHRIWYRLLDDETRAKWVKLYHSTVLLEGHAASDIADLYTEFNGSGQSIMDFYNAQDEENGAAFWAVITWILDWHSLKLPNLQLLLNEFPTDLAKLWPERELEAMDKELVISEYAKKSPEEFMAEAWAFYFSGRKDQLSERIINAVEATLAAAQSQTEVL